MDASANYPVPSLSAEILTGRPTIPLAEYNAAKAAVSAAEGRKAPAEGVLSAPLTPTIGISFPGAVQGENGMGFVPPDVDAAVGPTQILQPTNSSIDVFNKTGVHLRSINQNGFVGNFTDSLGDARAMYDPNFSRWVVLIDDFSNLTGSGKPQYYIAVSQTPDATGAYFVFPVFFNIAAGQFFDYPQLGMDQDALLLTANMFNNSTGAFTGPFMWAIPKAKVYNGIGFSVPVFAAAAGTGTIAPPYVLDPNGLDYFVAAPVGASKTAILKFTMAEAGRSNVAVSGPVSITVNSYSTPPPNAKQSCTGTNPQLTLDTLDGRFQNRSYQFGNSVWQVHTVTVAGSFPAPDFYQLNGSTNTIMQQGVFFKSATSYDFNPHIAANNVFSAMVTWTATDFPVGAGAQDAMVMFGGRTSGTAAGSMPVGGVVAGSTACLIDNFSPSFNRQRWGDYSAVNLDGAQPGSGLFWVTNEKIIGSSTSNPRTDAWGTHFARVTP